MAAGGGKLEIDAVLEAGFNSSVLEVDTQLASCKISDVTFIMYRQYEETFAATRWIVGLCMSKKKLSGEMRMASQEMK